MSYIRPVDFNSCLRYIFSMNTSLKNAVVASTIMHSIIFIPFFNLAMPMRDKDVKKDMVVDYVVMKEPTSVEIAQRQMTIKSIQTPRLELNKNVEVKPVASPKPAETKKDTIAKRKANDRIAKKEAQVRSTKDYVGYYQFIREKIRQRLKANYRDYRRQGEVRLTFTLASSGALRDIGIDSASSVNDNVLRDIAVLSLKEASPFPAFPKALSLPKMSFDVIISFKKE